MTKTEIINYVRKHPSGKVRVALTDLDGVLRGKYVSSEKFLSAIDHPLGFCDVVFGWDVNDATYTNTTFTGWHSGYPDAPVAVDLSTFRKIPWEGDVPFCLADLVDKRGEPVTISPRQLLKKVVNEAKKARVFPYLSQEFEWFNFIETPRSALEKRYRNLTPLTPGMFGYSILRSSLSNPYMSDLFSLLTKFNIPIEGLHTETGPGVYEAAIHFAEPVEAADRATLFKTGVKEIAYRHNILATFMAKVSEDLPGCSGHIHQSLWDTNAKRNLFFDAKDKLGMSSTMRSYMAGQLYCLPELLPMYAPTVNSFKRLVEGAWAPTTVTWGIDNRTVALRAIPSGKNSCRLETRVVGSDANPYLAMAAALASGLYGVKKKLALKQRPTSGSGYEDLSNGTLPKTLDEATQRMKKSKLVEELFGTAFISHFVQTREWEWRQQLKAVTDWELRRYLEII